MNVIAINIKYVFDVKIKKTLHHMHTCIWFVFIQLNKVIKQNQVIQYLNLEYMLDDGYFQYISLFINIIRQ